MANLREAVRDVQVDVAGLVQLMPQKASPGWYRARQL